jgi:hypothetical protein
MPTAWGWPGFNPRWQSRPVVGPVRRGPADPSITLRVYVHVINEQLVEAAEIFAKKIEAA